MSLALDATVHARGPVLVCSLNPAPGGSAEIGIGTESAPLAIYDLRSGAELRSLETHIRSPPLDLDWSVRDELLQLHDDNTMCHWRHRHDVSGSATDDCAKPSQSRVASSAPPRSPSASAGRHCPSFVELRQKWSFSGCRWAPSGRFAVISSTNDDIILAAPASLQSSQWIIYNVFTAKGSGSVLCTAFSPNGGGVGVGFLAGQCVVLPIAVVQKEEEETPKEEPCEAGAPVGAKGGGGGGEVASVRWQLPSFAAQFSSWPLSAAFSPDSSLVAFSMSNSRIYVGSASTGSSAAASSAAPPSAMAAVAAAEAADVIYWEGASLRAIAFVTSDTIVAAGADGSPVAFKRSSGDKWRVIFVVTELQSPSPVQ
eukprot:GHVU01079812.1.p1 GENE.GHVU01079812.1~~GHVU01079812.1.p1  ORF type:complete len:370 (+),score=68.19 GHVU01079812.1:1209-2318(+)